MHAEPFHAGASPPVVGGSQPTWLFVVDGFGMGGAETQLLQLLERLAREPVRTVVFSTGAEGPLHSRFVDVADRVVSRPKRGPFDTGVVREIVQVMALERPQLGVSLLFWADVATAIATFFARRLRVPLVSWQHVLPSRDRKNRHLRHRLAYRWALPRFDRLVCCAQAVSEDLGRTFRVPTERRVVVANGVDLERFTYQPATPDAQRFRIGMVSRFEAEKRHADVIAALASLRDMQPALELLLYGQGSLRDTIRRQADAAGVGERVHFLGTTHDMRAAFAGLDALVLPSAYEALPVAVLEAMACGCPVLASDVAGTREAAGADAALYFPPGDTRALAGALERLATDAALRERLRVAGRRRVEACFDRRVQERRLLEVLQGVVAGGTFVPPGPNSSGPVAAPGDASGRAPAR